MVLESESESAASLGLSGEIVSAKVFEHGLGLHAEPPTEGRHSRIRGVLAKGFSQSAAAPALLFPSTHSSVYCARSAMPFQSRSEFTVTTCVEMQKYGGDSGYFLKAST